MIPRLRSKFAQTSRPIVARLRPLAFAAMATGVHLFLNVGVVFAQAGKSDEEEATKSWVVPYAMVISLVGLGMLAVCRPSQRQAELPLKK